MARVSTKNLFVGSALDRIALRGLRFSITPNRYGILAASIGVEVGGLQYLIEFCDELRETMVVLLPGDEIAKVLDTPFSSFV